MQQISFFSFFLTRGRNWYPNSFCKSLIINELRAGGGRGLVSPSVSITYGIPFFSVLSSYPQSGLSRARSGGVAWLAGV